MSVTAVNRPKMHLDKDRIASLTVLIDQIYKDALDASLAMPGIQLYIESPRLNVKWGDAVGFTDLIDNPCRESLTINHPLRVASNTKAFVAAAILRLWEERQWIWIKLSVI